MFYSVLNSSNLGRDPKKQSTQKEVPCYSVGLVPMEAFFRIADLITAGGLVATSYPFACFANSSSSQPPGLSVTWGGLLSVANWIVGILSELTHLSHSPLTPLLCDDICHRPSNYDVLPSSSLFC